MTKIKTKEVRVDLSKFWDEGLTNKEVADATGIHLNTIGSYRNGSVRKPRIDILLALRDYFAQRLAKKISLEDLIKTVEDKT